MLTQALFYTSLGRSDCGECGRPTQERCASCNPMPYICDHCQPSHRAEEHREPPMSAVDPKLALEWSQTHRAS